MRQRCTRRQFLGLLLLAVGPAGHGCRTPEISEPPPHARISVRHEAETVRFAVIGDYGADGRAASRVAGLVQSWNPDFVITLGDNNYPDGAAETMDANIGKHYHEFIAPYVGTYGTGATHNRFFPTLGNHDWRSRDLAPYLEYFALPGNERYYEFRWGPVALFALDSDPEEPDGVTVDSKQAQWLESRMTQSDAPWKLVYMHHPPHSSGEHGPAHTMRWPFFAWGATAVLSGHDHHYERIERDQELYFINGLGGHPRKYATEEPTEGSVVRYNGEHGAMLVEASEDSIRFQFVTIDRLTVDETERRHGGPELED